MSKNKFRYFKSYELKNYKIKSLRLGWLVMWSINIPLLDILKVMNSKVTR
jgi:hypothetical protein